MNPIGDADLDRALRLSLRDLVSDRLLALRAQAKLALAEYGVVRTPCGVEGELALDAVVGDGFCFYRALRREFGEACMVSFDMLAAFALARLAAKRVEHSAFVPDDAETAERRAALQHVGCYVDVADVLTPFDCYVLDKCEGVLLGECGFARRWADHLEMDVIMRCLGIDALVVDPVSMPRAELRPNAAIAPVYSAERQGDFFLLMPRRCS